MYKYFNLLFNHHIGNRRLALGWPPAASQERRLSYGIDSPLALGSLDISFDVAFSNRSASSASCRLVGESLPGRYLKNDSEGLLVKSFQHSTCASCWYSPPCFGLAFGNKPGRAPVLLRRLTLGAGQLRDFVESGVFNQICFFIQLPASGEIASCIRPV